MPSPLGRIILAQVQLALGYITIQVGKPNSHSIVGFNLECQLASCAALYIVGISLFKYKSLYIFLSTFQSHINRTFVASDIGEILSRGQVRQDLDRFASQYCHLIFA